MSGRHIYISETAFVEALLLAGFYLKQFYILPSGSLQIGDILILAGVLLTLFPRFKIDRTDKWLVLFVVCVFVINMVYGIVRHNSSYTNHTIFYVFNLMFVIGIRKYVDSDNFLRHVSLALKAGLLTQIAIYLLHLGRRYDATRYMGTWSVSSLGSWDISELPT